MYLYLRNVSFDSFDVEPGTNDECMRPYIVQPVDFSNMLLLVVNTDCIDTMSLPLSVVPEEVTYENNSLVCQKALTTLKRKRPEFCIRTHPRESEIKDLCGLAVNATPDIYLLILLVTSCVLVRRVVLGHD